MRLQEVKIALPWHVHQLPTYRPRITFQAFFKVFK